MRFSKNIRGIVLFALSTIILASCAKPKLKKINPEYAIPLAYGKLGVADVLSRVDSSDLIQVNDDGLMALVYDGNLINLRASDLFSFPNTNTVFSQNSPLTLSSANFPQGQTAEFSGSAANNLSLDGITAQQIVGKGGAIRINLTSTFANDVSVNLTIPEVTQNGNPLQVTLDIPSTNNVPKSDERLINFGNYQIDFGANNEINFNYIVTVTSNGNPVLPSDGLVFTVDFEEITFRTFSFDPIDRVFDIDPDSIDLKIFKNSNPLAEVIDFGFFNPSIGFQISNGFALSSEIEIQQLLTSGNDNGINDPIILNSSFPNPLPLAAPNTPFETAVTRDSISKNNSNINEVLTPEDKSVVYDLSFRTLNTGSVASISDESALTIDAKVNLPLTGFTKGWSLSDTLALEQIPFDDIIDATLYVDITNQFPIDASFQLYFLDGNGVQLDSLIEGDRKILPTGGIDPVTGRSEVASSQLRFVLNEQKVAALNEATNIYFVASLNTPGADNTPPTQISIYKEYFIELRFAIQAQFKDILNFSSDD